jgi:hypothetical protein
MKTFHCAAITSLLLATPSLASADVTFKNKDKKEVEFVIKRAGSSQSTSVPGGVTSMFPGSSLTFIINAKGKIAAQKVDAVDGDTLIFQNGKLTRVADPDAPKPDETPAPDAPAPDKQ